tara:strand:+ start:752 stop:961 length:210 start_codon:yes stop_codon:yes gene_type:complete
LPPEGIYQRTLAFMAAIDQPAAIIFDSVDIARYVNRIHMRYISENITLCKGGAVLGHLYNDSTAFKNLA